MTQTAKLQAKMRECNYTIDTLAKAMGLSRTGLFNKIHGKKEFLVSEVQSIGSKLALTEAEIQTIFFAPDVEFKSTSDMSTQAGTR